MVLVRCRSKQTADVNISRNNQTEPNRSQPEPTGTLHFRHSNFHFGKINLIYHQFEVAIIQNDQIDLIMDTRMKRASVSNEFQFY